MRRALLVALAAITMIAGGGLLAIAGWIHGAFGADGVASASLGTMSSSAGSSAIVLDIESARVRLPVVPVHGETTVRLVSLSGEELLAGSEQAGPVDTFIGTREFDAAYRSGDRWSLIHVEGRQSNEPWQVTPTWMRSGSTLDLSISDGQTLAIAHSSGSTGVHVEASLRYSAPRAPLAARILAVCGFVLLGAGLVMAWSAIWLMRRRANERES